MKKMLWSLLTVFMLLILASCGTNDNDENNPTTGSEQQETEPKVSTQLNVDANGEAVFLIKNESNKKVPYHLPVARKWNISYWTKIKQ